MPAGVQRRELNWKGQAAVAAGMVALTLFGWATVPDAHHAVWWPAAGLAFSHLRARGRSSLWGVLVGAGLGAVAAVALVHADAVLAFAEFSGDLAVALFAAAGATRLRLGELRGLRRTLSGWGLTGGTALLGTLVSLAPHLVEDTSGFGADFAQRFMARLCGIAAVAPLAMPLRRTDWQGTSKRVEAVTLGVALAVVSAAAFAVAPGGTQVALVFGVFLPLVAAALRLPAPAPQVGVLFVSTVAVIASRADTGLFGPPGMEPALQVFLVFVASTTQLVAAFTSERERAFQALAESERRFRLMTDNGRDLVCLHGLDGAFRRASASSTSILGRDPDELSGRQLLEYVHPGDVLSVSQQLERVVEGQATAMLRFRFRHKEGTWVWLEMTVQPTLDQEGHAALHSATRDISERMRDLERLRLACQSAGIAVFRWDILHDTMVDEGRFAELYGVDLTRQAQPFQALLACLHPDDRASAASALAAALAGSAGYRTRFRALHPTRGERHIFACGEVERDGSGRPVSMIGVNWDVTDQVRVEGELRLARDQARDAVRAKAAFLAMMSHEIRTPLNGIIGMTDALLPDVDRGNRNAVETIRRSGEMLLAVLNDILDFSKIDAGKLELEARRCHLEQVLGDVGSLYARLTQEKGLALKLDASAAVGPLVCDPLRLRQVLGNLVSNAVKFTAAGSITLSCRALIPTASAPAGTVAIDVADTGIGIPADKVGRLFQEFSQVDASTTRRYGGTGLGLAIARRLVDAMGGTLSVNSEAGRGTTFTVTLPLPTAEQLAAAEAAVELVEAVPVLDASSLRGRRALLADDNAINRRVAVALLGKIGLEVEAVEDGRQALTAWARGGWDVIVMDMQMPELDGLEATRLIRAAEAERGLAAIPILAMTANAFQEDRRACLEAGMNDVVTKPATRAALQSALVRLLGREAKAVARASA
jgi:PAS domain S-box-containing protein